MLKCVASASASAHLLFENRVDFVFANGRESRMMVRRVCLGEFDHRLDAI